MKRLLSVRLLFLALFILISSGCQKGVTQFEKGSFPKHLSEWNVVFVKNNTLALNDGVVAYDLNTPLFTDYAHKLRTIWIPAGKSGTYSEVTDIELPIGSIVTKTFFYPRRGEQLLQTNDESHDFNDAGLDMAKVKLIETRLMVRLEDGWQGLPYVWNETQDEAFLEIAGDAKSLNLLSSDGNKEVQYDFQYIIPDFNQCQACHVENLNTKEMGLIGVKVRHLNRAYSHLHEAPDQLAYMVKLGILSELPITLPMNSDWKIAHSKKEELNHKARSYLDINCGHCHNPAGAADTSGLFLHMGETNLLKLGQCKPPVAAGQGTGGRPVDIQPGDAEESILSYRMQSLDLGAMMPELGRSSVHVEGVQLISEWINAMEGGC